MSWLDGWTAEHGESAVVGFTIIVFGGLVFWGLASWGQKTKNKRKKENNDG